MEAFENLLGRRSVRKYTNDPVPAEVLDRILEAGTYAPTGRNLQSPIMIAVTDRETIREIEKVNAEIMGVESATFYGAPALIMVLADRSVDTYQYDGTLVMGNLLNAAHAAGLGSCYIFRAKEYFEREEGKALLARLGISGDYEGIGNCILGYSAEPARNAAPRKEKYIYKI